MQRRDYAARNEACRRHAQQNGQGTQHDQCCTTCGDVAVKLSCFLPQLPLEHVSQIG